MKRASMALIALLILFSVRAFAQVSAVPQLLNFQGRLAKPDGTPVSDGTYSLRFSLWSALTGGTEKWNQTIASVNVKNGVFGVLLNVGTGPADLFSNNLWFEIKIGSNAALTPRQQLVSVAFAMKANTVPDGSITTNSLANGAVTGSKIASATITADKIAQGVLGSTSWNLTGNSSIDDLSNFLGTTTNKALVFKVNNRRTMRYAYAENTASAGFEYRSINLLGGSELNSITAGVVGATLAGGGLDYFTGTDYPNQVQADFGVIGGGFGNTVSKHSGAIAGGRRNTVGGVAAVIGGGENNIANFDDAVIGGGELNNAAAGHSAITGGYQNTANGDYDAIGGGYTNTASGSGTTIAGGTLNNATTPSSTIGGGASNTTSGTYATIAGGRGNVASEIYTAIGGGSFNNANGWLSTVPGGSYNTAGGNYSFAAGQNAQANHAGTFVWNDALDTDLNHFFASTGSNQFLVHATGGVGINTNDPAGFALNVNGTGKFSGNLTVNTTTYTSDARYKTHVQTFENALDAILNLRGVTFDWRRDEFQRMNFTGGRQIGFIAQEVEKVLPELVSTDKNGYKSVAYSNVVPVTVEAIKAQQRQIETLKTENAELKAQLVAILTRLEKMEKAHENRK